VRSLRAVAGHPAAPGAAHLVEGSRHIGVVIARHHGNVISAAEHFKPLPGHVDLDVERQVDEVAGHRDMVRLGCLHIGHDRIYDIVMQELAPVAMPVHVAGDPLGDEIAIGYIGKRTKMDVGKMREPEHKDLLTHDPERMTDFSGKIMRNNKICGASACWQLPLE
jgi:hypothetical protein